jgi:hypothetical protein
MTDEEKARREATDHAAKIARGREPLAERCSCGAPAYFYHSRSLPPAGDLRPVCPACFGRIASERHRG